MNFVKSIGLTSACGTACTNKYTAAEAHLSHTQHGVQVIEGPRPVSGGCDEVFVGGVQRHTHHLTRVVRQHSLHASQALKNSRLASSAADLRPLLQGAITRSEVHNQSVNPRTKIHIRH